MLGGAIETLGEGTRDGGATLGLGSRLGEGLAEGSGVAGSGRTGGRVGAGGSTSYRSVATVSVSQVRAHMIARTR